MQPAAKTKLNFRFNSYQHSKLARCGFNWLGGIKSRIYAIPERELEEGRQTEGGLKLHSNIPHYIRLDIPFIDNSTPSVTNTQSREEEEAERAT